MKYLSRKRYSIQFTGAVLLDRPLQPAQAAYVQRFLHTRRITWRVEQIQEIADPLREAVRLPLGPEGAYFVGLNFDDVAVAEWRPLVLNQSKPPQGQPQRGCPWHLNETGDRLIYGGEKYELCYCSAWLKYFIDHFLAPWGYILNGEIIWQGDDEADHGLITVNESQIEHRLFQVGHEKQLAQPDQPIGCVHQDALETKLVCVRLAHPCNQEVRGRWFTGQGREFYLVCQLCLDAVKHDASAPPLGQICWRCYNEWVASGMVGEMIGQPEALRRSTDLTMVCQSKNASLPARLLDIQPIDARQESIWIALTREGQLIEINLTTDVSTPLFFLPSSRLNLDQEVALHIAQDGQHIAIANLHGQYGLVLDLATGQITMRLERDAYLLEHCDFPLAFFADGQRLLLIHGTQWNRVDIADPRTGESLSERSFVVPPGEKRPPHYLDYFHGQLRVSSDQQRVVDNGWIWHPVGSVVAWNIQRWLHENPWEAEDGPSMLELCQRTYYWGGPLCWINERVVAVWGYGDDELELIPAVRLFDVVAEKELDWFAGPEGELIYDEYLFALSEQYGLTAWDVATGERVLSEPDFHPTRYHRGAKQFLQIDWQHGKIRVGTLVFFV